jgi:predicted nucleic acid-binding Zn ribbon protein
MPNGPRDADSPERLADLLSRFLKKRGMDARIKQTAVLDEWATLVGPDIAAVTRPLTISDDGTLFVAVRTPAWMSELTMMERDLLASVNRITPERPILRVRWSLMR